MKNKAEKNKGNERVGHRQTPRVHTVSGERMDRNGHKRPRLRHVLVTLPAGAVPIDPGGEYWRVPF